MSFRIGLMVGVLLTLPPAFLLGIEVAEAPRTVVVEKEPLPPKIITRKEVETKYVNTGIPNSCTQLLDRLQQFANSSNRFANQADDIFEKVHNLDAELLENTSATRDTEEWLSSQLEAFELRLRNVFTDNDAIQGAVESCLSEVEK